MKIKKYLLQISNISSLSLENTTDSDYMGGCKRLVKKIITNLRP